MASAGDRRTEELERQKYIAAHQARHLADHGRIYERRVEELEGQLGLAKQQAAHMAKRSVVMLDQARRESPETWERETRDKAHDYFAEERRQWASARGLAETRFNDSQQEL